MIALSPGTIFLGRYEVVRRLKAGGMGAIYEVIHLETRRRRALKLMSPDRRPIEALKALTGERKH